MPRNPNAVRCAALTKSGEPCPNWAMHSNEFCKSHTNAPPNPEGPGAANQHARTHGLYARFFTTDDLAALATVSDSPDLSDEIAITRVVIRRIAKLIDSADVETAPALASTVESTAALASALFLGTGRIAMLLRTQKELGTGNNLQSAIEAALDEIAMQKGIEL